jgi:hypothetical protein
MVKAVKAMEQINHSVFQLEDGRILHLVVVAVRDKCQTQSHHHHMVEDHTRLINVFVDKTEAFDFKRVEHVNPSRTTRERMKI